MHEFELILLFMVVGVTLTLVSPRLGVPWPAVLAIVGTLLALTPWVPTITFDPKLALTLFFAPVLLNSAFDTSPRALRENWRAVGSLGVILVVLTVIVVAVVARQVVPDMPWAAAVALGAVVAPPDAAAATSILQQFRLPNRIVVILEGESLLNDASVLLIFEGALIAAASGVSLWTFPLLVVEAAGGLVVGWGLARLYLLTVARYVNEEHMAASVLLQFIGTFAVWILADTLSLSPVLTVVAYGMTIAQHAHRSMTPRQRRANYAVWEVAVYGLNVMAFLLTGLQIRSILWQLNTPWNYALLAGAVLGTCIVVRIIWVALYNTVLNFVRRRWQARKPRSRNISFGSGVVLAWTGMRGILTLGAALGLPANFPQRDLIQFTAFAVVIGTLGFQGMTLGPLIRLLKLPPDTRGDEEALARKQAARAALERLGERRESVAGGVLAQQYERRLEQEGEAIEPTQLMRLQREVLGAEREAMFGLHRDGAISDEVFQEMEEELDWAEAALDRPSVRG